MKHGFVKAAAVTPRIRVADPEYNVEQMKECLKEAEAEEAAIIVFPELCVTGYTCQDLFLQETLLEGAREGLKRFASYTVGTDALIFAGLPLEKDGKLYNAAAVIQRGKVLAFIPKTRIPNYAEFYEARYFSAGSGDMGTVRLDGEEIPMGANILFRIDAVEGLTVGCEICEDVWAADTPSTNHALAGATVIVNLSASNETVGKDVYRESLVQSTSARLVAGYIYASAGEGESTQDLVFGGHNMIAENGKLIAKAKRFGHGNLYGELDLHRIRHERRWIST